MAGVLRLRRSAGQTAALCCRVVGLPAGGTRTRERDAHLGDCVVVDVVWRGVDAQAQDAWRGPRALLAAHEVENA